jgi:hypothetical protein
MLPPGCARFVTNPWATGSETSTKTTCMLRVVRTNAAKLALPEDRMTSGVIPTNSAASAPIRSGSAVGQRKSMRKFCPSRQPSR